VLGESGSGKSSLVRAGLLPDMIEFGWVEHTKWKWFDVMPSQFRGNVCNGILSKLDEAFPVLNEKQIGKDLMAGKEVNFGHLADVLPDTNDEAVLFFIDQFEEIFTDPLITEEERICAFSLLNGMASTHKIWLIFSMRNDFYHRFTAYPALSELKNNGIVYDLPKILYSELQEIIEEPARKAGLKWETNEQGIALNKNILHDINKGVDDLPLIEFALSELYNLRNENNVLTYRAYEDIGKIDGAVVKYVDNFYNTLSDKEKELFYQLLSALIAPSVDNKNVYVRKTSLLRELQKSELHKSLISNLINSHILISGKDENGEPTVSIVHEILISSWKVIQDWIEQEKYFIDANNHYENLSKYWIEHNKTKNDLLQGSVAIKEAEYFLYAWENNSSANVRDFLLASVKKEKRAFLPLVSFVLLIGGIIGLVQGIGYLSVKSTQTMNGFSVYLLLTGIFIYATWKRIKAVPIHNTINVSLIAWSIAFLFSVVLLFSSRASGIWIINVLLLSKLVFTVFQKREILQWKKRIFKRSFNFLSLLLDNSSKTLQKALKLFFWILSVLLIAILGTGGVALYVLQKENNNFKKSHQTIDRLFEGLDDSSTLSTSERIFINRQRVEYLQKIFFQVLPDWFIGEYVTHGGWTSGRYYQYALYQYRLGHPEDFLEGIKESLETDSKQTFNQTLLKSIFSLQLHSQTMIKAAFELGLFDECRKLIDIYKDNLDAEITFIRDELNSERLSAFAFPSDDTNTKLAEPFTGKWQFEENGHRINLEITKDTYNLCRYLFQIRKNDQNEWIDNDIAVTRYRFKQIDNKTIMEEYNARTHVLSVSEISLVNENELRVISVESGEIWAYKRLE
jgi:hypothetical protein